MSLVSTLIRSPSTLLYFLKCSPLGGVRGSPTLPLSDGLPQLHESDDAGGIGSQNAITRYVSTAGNTTDSSIPKIENAPIMPASTAPTPPAGDGIRFAAMPRKKPCTSTPNGTCPPNASKLAQSTPMFAAQNPTAPPIARTPRWGWRRYAIAVRTPV